MVAKFGEARRQAFFDALRATGNQTLAAEAAKVSLSWVTLHRGKDPKFRRLMNEAIAEARARLREHPERRPPSDWGFLDGEELVVKGTGGPSTRSGQARGRRVQIARARLHQWTPRIEDRFLAVLAATGNAEAAYTAVGISKGSAYAHRNRWPAFAQRWDEALAMASLNLEFALIRHRGNPFSSKEAPEPADLPPPPPEAALHQLHMTKHRLHGIGRKPGGWRKHDAEKVRARIVRAAGTIKRARELGEEEVARIDREFAARRRRE